MGFVVEKCHCRSHGDGFSQIILFYRYTVHRIGNPIHRYSIWHIPILLNNMGSIIIHTMSGINTIYIAMRFKHIPRISFPHRVLRHGIGSANNKHYQS